MDGRWKRWACAGLVAGGVGCNRNAVQQPGPTGLPGGERPSLLQQQFGSNPKFIPQAPAPELVPTRTARQPGDPPAKPETFVAMADVSAEGAFMEGHSAVERDQLVDAARQQYQQALKTDPKNQGALVGLARLYTKCGDKERAVAAYQLALQYHPRDHALAHKLAAVAVQFADWPAAAEACRYALKLDPENRTYHKTLGYCQAQLGQWDDGFATLLKAMPEAQARYFLGRVMIDHGRVDDGRQLVQVAYTQDPQFALAKQTLDDLDAGRLAPPAGIAQAGYTDPAQR